MAGGRRATAPAGLRVLVVEDEALVSMLIEDALVELGCIPIGPAAGVAEALDLLAAETAAGIDVALLDLDLAGETSGPVAAALAARGVPFAFVTGHSPPEVARRCGGHAGAPILGKPFDQEALAAVLGRLAAAATIGRD